MDLFILFPYRLPKRELRAVYFLTFIRAQEDGFPGGKITNYFNHELSNFSFRFFEQASTAWENVL